MSSNTLDDLLAHFPGAVLMRDVLIGVEALEQRRDEVLAAARNLIAQKGRHNTEIAYKRLVEVCKA